MPAEAYTKHSKEPKPCKSQIKCLNSLKAKNQHNKDKMPSDYVFALPRQKNERLHKTKREKNSTILANLLLAQTNEAIAELKIETSSKRLRPLLSNMSLVKPIESKKA